MRAARVFHSSSTMFFGPLQNFSSYLPTLDRKKTHFARSSSSRHWMATKSPTHWHSNDWPFYKSDSRSRKPYMQYWWRTTRLKSQIKVILSAFSGSFAIVPGAIVATVCTISCISHIRKWQKGTCGGPQGLVQFWWPCIAYFDVFNTVDHCVFFIDSEYCSIDSLDWTKSFKFLISIDSEYCSNKK